MQKKAMDRGKWLRKLREGKRWSQEFLSLKMPRDKDGNPVISKSEISKLENENRAWKPHHVIYVARVFGLQPVETLVMMGFLEPEEAQTNAIKFEDSSLYYLWNTLRSLSPEELEGIENLVMDALKLMGKEVAAGEARAGPAVRQA